MNDDSHDFESVNTNIEVLTSDVQQLRSQVKELIFQCGCLRNRVGVIEEQHSLFRRYEIDGGLEERLDKIELDLKTSPLFNKELIEKGNDAIDKRKSDIDKGYKKFKEEDTKVRKDIEDEAKRFIKDTDEKIRKTFDFKDKNPKKEPEDGNNGNDDVPKF